MAGPGGLAVAPMTKRHLQLLEKVFEAEIQGRLPFQSRAKGYKELEAMNLVELGTLKLAGRIPITVSGWYLTHAGRYAYCQSCTPIATHS